MFYSRTTHDAAGDLSAVTDTPRRKRRIGPRLKRSRDPGKADRYEARKLAGLCTTCGEPAAEDRQQCGPCLDKARASTRKYAARKAKERRAAGLCVKCERPSETYRCFICSIRAGEVPAFGPVHNPAGNHGGLHAGRDLSAPPTSRSGHERRAGKWTEETHNGKSTVRYAGQGKRGSPSKAVLDAQDHKQIGAAIERAWQLLQLTHTLQHAELPREQKKNQLQEALSHYDLARRFLDDLLDRYGYEP